MAAALFFALSVVGLFASASAWFPLRRLGRANPFYFLVAWLTGELALQHMAVQALVTLAFGFAGAFRSDLGLLGLTLTFASWGLLLACHFRSLGAALAVQKLALRSGLELAAPVSPVHGLWRPFRMKRAGLRVLRDLEYGPALPGDKGGRNLLDVVLPEGEHSGPPRPMLLQVHGGGWTIGNKEQQGQPLMAELASRGWVCFASNYRLSPQATFPDHIIDVKRAIAWIRAHAAQYGGDPGFLCITGGSAGGHLAALAALSANDPHFQPGFEPVDTRLQAAAPFYGVFDWLDRAGDRGSDALIPFLAKSVQKCRPEQDPERWEAASPLSRVSADAPPFLVVQGTHDSLVFVEEARTFVRALEEKSQQAVLYLELAGAQHAFDIFHSVRSAWAVQAVAAFLEKCHAGHLAAQQGGQREV